MRILILSDKVLEGGGGAEAVANMQAEGLKQEGHDVRVLAAESLPKYSERFRNWRGVYNPAGITLMRSVLQEFKPEIVHAHNLLSKFSLAVLKVAKQSGARVFLTAHDTYLFYPGKYFGSSGFWHELSTERLRFNPFRNFFLRRYLKYVDQIFAVSDALGNVLRTNGIENVTLHNGIDAGTFTTTSDMRALARERFALGEAPTVLWVGRLSGAKGGAVLPKIMKTVEERIPSVKLLAVGSELILPRAEMPLAYAAADIVVVPSVYLDPFPTVVLEAQAAAKPVVVTNYGGAKEAVREGETGYVADPNSPAFAERMVELLQDLQKRQEFGHAGRKNIQENFSLEAQVKQLVVWYNRPINPTA